MFSWDVLLSDVLFINGCAVIVVILLGYNSRMIYIIWEVEDYSHYFLNISRIKTKFIKRFNLNKLHIIICHSILIEPCNVFVKLVYKMIERQ